MYTAHWVGPGLGGPRMFRHFGGRAFGRIGPRKEAFSVRVCAQRVSLSLIGLSVLVVVVVGPSPSSARSGHLALLKKATSVRPLAQSFRSCVRVFFFPSSSQLLTVPSVPLLMRERERE